MIFGTLAAAAWSHRGQRHLATQRFARSTALLYAKAGWPRRRAWRAPAPLVDAVFAEPNLGAIKAQLALQVEMANTLRLPMTAASADARRVAACHDGALNARRFSRW